MSRVKTSVKTSIKIIALTLLLYIAGTGAAYADCTNPAGTEGVIVYNTTHKTMQFCDGTDWVSMGSISPSSGGGLDIIASSADHTFSSANVTAIKTAMESGYIVTIVCNLDDSGNDVMIAAEMYWMQDAGSYTEFYAAPNDNATLIHCNSNGAGYCREYGGGDNCVNGWLARQR